MIMYVIYKQLIGSNVLLYYIRSDIDNAEPSLGATNTCETDFLWVMNGYFKSPSFKVRFRKDIACS